MTHAFFCLSLCGELKGNVSYEIPNLPGPECKCFLMYSSRDHCSQKENFKMGTQFFERKWALTKPWHYTPEKETMIHKLFIEGYHILALSKE